MQDRVPVNPGRVLITPENGSAAYYATMTRADNPTQAGTPLNKASLLKDATAAKFGLGADAVPDDVFNVLSRFQNGLGNEYVWEKTKSVEVPQYTETQSTDGYIGGAGSTAYYSDTFHIENNTFVLDSPQSISWSRYTAPSIIGKYFMIENTSNTYMYKISDGATISESGGNVIISSYTRYSNPAIKTFVNSYGYVNSPDENAYPPAVSDGYTYIAWGQIGGCARIATVSYTGSGNKGNKDIVFPTVPKIVFISRDDHASSYFPYRWGDLYLNGIVMSSTSSSKFNYSVEISGATLTVNGSTTTINGLDKAGVVYTISYLA